LSPRLLPTPPLLPLPTLPLLPPPTLPLLPLLPPPPLLPLPLRLLFLSLPLSVVVSVVGLSVVVVGTSVVVGGGVSVVVVGVSVVVVLVVVDGTSFSALVQPWIQSFSSCSLRPAAACFAPNWHALSLLDQDWFVALCWRPHCRPAR
jgi:hypothetical protein